MISLDWIFERVSPEPNTGCWLWTGRGGRYGSADIDGRKVPAHRAAYEAAFGTIDPEMVIDHLCGENLCVNPAHLEQVTKEENSRRGRPQAQREGGRGVMRAFTCDRADDRAAAVLVRLQPEELERIREAAKRAGLGIGPWLRSLGMREASRGAGGPG